jgi:hypothetical protein
LTGSVRLPFSLDAVASLHNEGLQELMTLVRYCRLLALQLRVFRIGAPA